MRLASARGGGCPAQELQPAYTTSFVLPSLHYSIAPTILDRCTQKKLARKYSLTTQPLKPLATTYTSRERALEASGLRITTDLKDVFASFTYASKPSP